MLAHLQTSSQTWCQFSAAEKDEWLAAAAVPNCVSRASTAWWNASRFCPTECLVKTHARHLKFILAPINPVLGRRAYQCHSFPAIVQMSYFVLQSKTQGWLSTAQQSNSAFDFASSVQIAAAISTNWVSSISLLKTSAVWELLWTKFANRDQAFSLTDLVKISTLIWLVMQDWWLHCKSFKFGLIEVLLCQVRFKIKWNYETLWVSPRTWKYGTFPCFRHLNTFFASFEQMWIPYCNWICCWWLYHPYGKQSWSVHPCRSTNCHQLICRDRFVGAASWT